MQILRKAISLVLLSVYSIVLAHSIIPHHHHSDAITDLCNFEILADSSQAQQIFESGQHQCQHDHGSDVYCHFDVELIPSKIVFISTTFLGEMSLFKEPSYASEQEFIFAEQSFNPPSKFTKQPSELRGPPTLS